MSACAYVYLQVLSDSASEKFLAARRADQQRALQHLKEDPGLAGLELIQGPLFDLEVREVCCMVTSSGQLHGSWAPR